MKIFKPGMIVADQTSNYLSYLKIVATNDDQLLVSNPLPDSYIQENHVQTIDKSQAVHRPFLGPAFIDLLIMIFGRNRVGLMGTQSLGNFLDVETYRTSEQFGYRITTSFTRMLWRLPSSEVGYVPPVATILEPMKELQPNETGLWPFKTFTNLIEWIKESVKNDIQTSAEVPKILPGHRTSNVMGVAEAIFHSHAFDRLPVLADALQEAGLDNEVLLDHLQGDTINPFHGHWVIWELLRQAV